MVFSSLMFLFRFLPAVMVIYFAAPRRLKNGVLFFSSLFFYAWGEPVYVLLMLFSTLVDYFHGWCVEYYIEQGKRRKARLFVISSVVINLSLLGFFKYIDFFISNLNLILHSEIPLFRLTLPIGISFFTFQTMSYTIDIFRGEARAQKNIISFGAYVALFPQLIAGPIVQYKTIAEQLRSRRTERFGEGAMRFTIGLGKKVLLANNIGQLWDSVEHMQNEAGLMAGAGRGLPMVTAWLGITAFAFQIYFDFSGYSDMAIGLGRIFGFDFNENFNYPYMSRSLTEFWRRWHISLGTWFREYVYIPLGGNRGGGLKTIRNIMVVWLLTGFWHGASWNYMLWGGYYGIMLIIEKNVMRRGRERHDEGSEGGTITNIATHIYMLVMTWIGWAIFAIEDIGMGFSFIGMMFGSSGRFVDYGTGQLIANYWLLLVIMCLACTDYPRRIAVRAFRSLRETAGGVSGAIFMCIVFLSSVAYLVDSTYNPFLYFRF